MNLQTKIVLWSFAVVMILALLMAIPTSGGDLFGMGEGFLVFFGMIGMIAGLICIIIAIVAWSSDSKDWAQGFFLAGGLLLLVGFTTCGVILPGVM